MGCRAISPRLVGLASELEGKPFHLIATDRQRGKMEDQVGYLKSLGLSADSPNFTATSGGGHPKVKGNGYVPYYMIFDRHGKLVREHMCGDYHGGDGLEMIDRVKELLKETPPIYLGRKPFEVARDLADRIAWKKKLSVDVKELETRLATKSGGAEGEELQRLRTALLAWRDGELAAVEKMLAVRPSDVVDRLGALSKELKRTSLAEPVDVRLKELKASRELKDAVAIEKALVKARAAFDKADPRSRKAAAASARKKLEKEIEGHEDLPIAGTVRAWLAELP